MCVKAAYVCERTDVGLLSILKIIIIILNAEEDLKVQYVSFL